MVPKVNSQNNLWKEGKGCLCVYYIRIQDIKSLVFLRDPVFKSSWDVLSGSSGWLWRRTGVAIRPPSPFAFHVHSRHLLTLLCPSPPGTPLGKGKMTG